MAMQGTANANIPAIGFGTWQRRDGEARQTTLWALEAGYRHIDTAEGYGNEAAVGRALADAGLARDQLFITTKVAPENLGPGMVRPHVLASLEKLRLDAVDLLLVHWPAAGDRFEVAHYMAQFAAVQDEGLTRLIGVSNFTKRHLDQAIAAVGAARIATNQVECHVLLQNRVIVDHTQAKGIPITAYCPLARGRFMEVPQLETIARRHEATVAQVGLAFLLAEGHIVIPTSSKQANIRSNLAAARLKLTADEVAAIRKLDQGQRLVNGGWAPAWDV